MKRGRPVKSQIRQNIVEILYFVKSAYAYQVCKIYKEIFPKVSTRVIYYHLKKGEQLKEFEVDKIVKEKGDFSWGSEAEKIYYKLGPDAKPTMDTRVKDYVERKKNG